VRRPQDSNSEHVRADLARASLPSKLITWIKACNKRFCKLLRGRQAGRRPIFLSLSVRDQGVHSHFSRHFRMVTQNTARCGGGLDWLSGGAGGPSSRRRRQ
jgi:hypothetical protein